MCIQENSAHQRFGSEVWHCIVGQVALRENETGVSEASQFLNPSASILCSSTGKVCIFVSASAAQQTV